MWVSLRCKDLAVLLSTLGSLLLQLAVSKNLSKTTQKLIVLKVITSTALILLESSPVEKTGEVALSSTFVSNIHNLSGSPRIGDAIVRYYGIQSKNLPYPVATSANVTIEKFPLPEGSTANTSYTADVKGISASLECEPLEIANATKRISMPWESILAPFFSMNITTPSCNISGVPIGMGTDHNPPHTDTTSSYQGWWSNYTCNDGIQNDEYSDDPTLSPKPVIPGFDDHRLVMVTSLVQWTSDNSPSADRVTWVQDFTAIMCKPTYSIDTYSVTLSKQQADQKEPFTAVKRPATSGKINGFTNDLLVPLLKASTDRSRLIEVALRGVVTDVGNDHGYERPQDPWFVVMSEVYGDSGVKALMNQSALLEVAPKAFSGAMAQIFHDEFTTPSETRIAAQIRAWENRLRLKVIPVVLIMTFLGLMMCIATGMVFLGPKHAVPTDPQSILAKAKLLAPSQSLSSQLLAINGLGMGAIQHKLTGRAYQSIMATKGDIMSFTIGSSWHQENLEADQEKPGLPSKAQWQPLTQKFWFAIVTISLPLVSIAVLEGLQHVSNSNHGLLDFSASGNRQIFMTLIPAAIMSGITLLYSSLHFSTSLIAPFHALNRGGVTADYYWVEDTSEF